MDLAGHQRILLGLMRSNYQVQDGDDAYFHRVAASRDLGEARENVYLWRVYVLERSCVLTTALLRRTGQFDAALQAFIRSHNVSPFREYQPLAFLAALAAHADQLVVSVSQFELALMKVRAGDAGDYRVAWQVEPGAVLHGLASGLPFEQAPAASFVTRVSRALPHGFDIQSR